MRTNRIFWILFVAIGIYGGYFGYCRYKAIDKVRAFERQGHSLRQYLLRQKNDAEVEDIQRAVASFALKAKVTVDPKAVKVTIEPLTPQSASKLSTIEQQAMSFAGQITRHRTPRYLVGFQAKGRAKHGIATREFSVKHYTWVDDAVIPGEP